MLKFFLSAVLCTLSIEADVLEFYKNTLQTLEYKKTYSLYEQANTLQKDGISLNRFLNFSLDADYTDTKAKLLADSFHTSNITLRDTIDIFDKSTYKLEELMLDTKAQKTLLDIQKEQLFISLVSMISSYHQTNELVRLHQSLLTQQESIYEKFQSIELLDAISKIDILRFKNTLVTLKRTIIDEQMSIEKMQRQLDLYAPKQNIPSLDTSKYLYTKEEFLSQNKEEKLNQIASKQLLAQAKSSSNAYLPDLVLGLNYQKLDDPSSYGDNYSINAAIHIPLSSNDFKKAQALRISALSTNSKNTQFKIQREQEFNQKFQDYKNAQKQLRVLNESLQDYLKSEEMIKTAYMKQYVDFNTYLQVLTESTSIQEQIIKLTYLQNEQSTILNAIASGAIYE